MLRGSRSHRCMKQVKYILVHETARKNASCDVTYRHEPHLGYCSYVSCPDIDILVELRKQWPEAPILGMSEIDHSASHAPIQVSEAMNQLRRVLSDLTD